MNPNKEGRFKQLLFYVTDNPGSVYALQIGETTVHARFDTCYESDNGMEMDEPGYEEYWCIAFQDICSGKLFEISYHNLPEQIWDDTIQVI